MDYLSLLQETTSLKGLLEIYKSIFQQPYVCKQKDELETVELLEELFTILKTIILNTLFGFPTDGPRQLFADIVANPQAWTYRSIDAFEYYPFAESVSTWIDENYTTGAWRYPKLSLPLNIAMKCATGHINASEYCCQLLCSNLLLEDASLAKLVLILSSGKYSEQEICNYIELGVWEEISSQLVFDILPLTRFMGELPQVYLVMRYLSYSSFYTMLCDISNTLN